MSTLKRLQRLTFNLPTGQFASQTEEELIDTLIYNLKSETWHFVKKTFDIALTQTPEGVFFKIPQEMNLESTIKVMLDFFNKRWSVVLPEITFTVDPVDDNGYLV